MSELVQIGKIDKIEDNNPFNDTTKVLYHADRLSDWLNNGTTFPINIEVNMIDVCNQACFANNDVNILTNTENKWIKLSDFSKNKKNPLVFTHKNNLKKVEDVINTAYYTGTLYKIFYKIKDKVFSIETTDDHQFFYDENTQIYSKDLKVNDTLIASNPDNISERLKAKIIKIKTRFVENKKVYCLTIKDDSSFIVDGGLISRNCRWCISNFSHVSNPSLKKEEKRERLSIVNQNFSAPNGRKIQQGLDIEYLKKFLKDAKVLGTKSIVYSGGGESAIHPDIGEAIQYAHSIGLDVGLMTNGQFKKNLIPIIGNHCKWARFSLDTFNEEAYEYQKFTKGFKQVISNIKDLTEYPVKLGLNINVAEWNHEEIISFGQKAKELGVDYAQARPVLMLGFEQKYNDPYRTPLGEDLLNKIIPMLKESEELSDENFKYLVSWDKFKKIRDFEGNFGRPYKSCEAHQFMNVLGSDGSWTTCMYYLGNKKHIYGNIYENSVKEIWESAQKKEVDRHLKEDLDLNQCQVSCHQCNWNTMLHYIKHPKDDMDINFV